MLWLIILMIALAILPDLLRRRQRQKARKGPIPIPPRRKPLETKYKRDEPAVEKGEPPAGPLLSEAVAVQGTQNVPLQQKQQKIQLQKKTFLQVPRRRQAASWSTLTLQARELYSGFIWSEIWQAPLAKRRKIR